MLLCVNVYSDVNLWHKTDTVTDELYCDRDSFLGKRVEHAQNSFLSTKAAKE